MKVSVIIAHPDTKSLNHAIAFRVVAVLERNSYTISFHDLYEENFDPILPMSELPNDAQLPEDIKMYCEELCHADGMVIVHPNWWGQPPAILKGWVDRIFRMNIAYRFIEIQEGVGKPIGLLKAKTAIVFNTSNTPPEQEELYGDPLENLWGKCILDFCGINNYFRKMFSAVITSTTIERKSWLNDVERITDKYFPPLRKIDNTFASERKSLI